MPDIRTRPVFHDPRNLRWRWVRSIALVLGGVISVAFGVAAISVLVSPALPALGLKSPRVILNPGHLLPLPRKPWALSPRERVFQQAKTQLAESFSRGVAASVGPGVVRRKGPEMSAFYVNWDDTSFTSLKTNLDSLDKVTAEWLHIVTPDGQVVVDDEGKVDQTLKTIRAPPSSPACHRPRQ